MLSRRTVGIIEIIKPVEIAIIMIIAVIPNFHPRAIRIFSDIVTTFEKF